MAGLTSYGDLPAGRTQADYVSMGGSARHYVNRSDPTEIISRRTYSSVGSAVQGWKNYGEYQREKQSTRYQAMLEAYAKKQHKSKASLDKVDSAFARKYAAALHGDKKPHGKLAKFLEYIGWRQRDAEYAVGDTPVASRRGGWK